MAVDSIASDIRKLNIQGAENIARAATQAILNVISHSKAHQASKLYHELQIAKKKLFVARPTEPCMRNALNYVFHNLHGKDLPDLIMQAEMNVRHVKSYFDEADKKIAETGSKLISKGAVVYTHCHSSTVMRIIKRAASDGKNFEVHNTETRPRLQGRKTALELSKAGIKVSHYVDSAMRLALKKADVCLIGADAIQSNGVVVNKIGSELVAEAAAKLSVPVYVCTPSWKADPFTLYTVNEPIENRHRSEVWDKAPRKIQVMNPAFEMIDPGLITSVISEIGSYSPDVFIVEVKRRYPWMFH